MGWLLLIFAALAAAGGRGGSGQEPSMTSHGRQELEALLGRLAGVLDENQRRFLVMVARGESGWSSGAKNDSASEAAAAGKAYDRHADLFAKCPYPRSAWAFGSGGWFGLLPANPAWHLRHVWPCLDPVYVFNPAMTIVAAIAFARALQGYKSYQAHPTVYTLRAGWANPGWMVPGKAPADRRQRWGRHAQESGYGEAFLDAPVKRYPSNYAEIYAILTAGGPQS